MPTSRIRSITSDEVTFTSKDRAHADRIRTETIPGTEFVRRYLRHVLPRGMRSIRYFGFCHPAAKTDAPGRARRRVPEEARRDPTSRVLLGS